MFLYGEKKNNTNQMQGRKMLNIAQRETYNY